MRNARLNFVDETFGEEVECLIIWDDEEFITITIQNESIYIKKYKDIKEFIKENEQKHRVLGSFEYNNDDKLFIAEEKVIKNISKESCVIVGRCASYVLKDNKDTVKIFLYSSEEDKIKRAIKYYNIPKNKAKNEIEKINKMRDKHYSYYTGSSLYNPSNYDLMINVDSLGVEGTADYIIEYIMQKK